MLLSTGELSAIGGSILMMTATASPRTIRILKAQFSEVSNWKMLLSSPLRSNVTFLIPPSHTISNDFEVSLAPYIKDMKENKTTYLIIVRGKILFIN